MRSFSDVSRLWKGSLDHEKLRHDEHLHYRSVVRVTQARLFAHPQPLVERLGHEFFRQLPDRPGVYLMRDQAATVLYVGKAKSLRKRVCSYRVANPERMARRTLCLLRLVATITWEECSDERSALRRESELLLSLKPRFNRAGVWRGPDRFLLWRICGDRIEFAVSESCAAEWNALGPMGAKAVYLRSVLLRIFSFVAHPENGLAQMPVGWMHGVIGEQASVFVRDSKTATAVMYSLTRGDAVELSSWIRTECSSELHPFVRTAVESDLELLLDLMPAKQMKTDSPNA